MADEILIDPVAETLDSSQEIVEGQWYWVTPSGKHNVDNCGETKKGPFFACVTWIGSNYVEMTAVTNGGSSTRVHLDVFEQFCRRETEPERVIREEVNRRRAISGKLLARIKEETIRLGLTAQPQQIAQDTQALVQVGQNTTYKDHKKALVRAKEKTLPTLFKELEEANQKLAVWMGAEALPLRAQVNKLSGVLEHVADRILNLELYAGLVETITQIQEGDPAPHAEQVRVMQRLCYMDEECLAHYEIGGMRYKDIKAFDRWLLRPDNLNRIFPFPRGIVGFQIRREDAPAPELFNFIQLMQEIREREADRSTHLYLRNGDQVYRLTTKLKFNEQLFPMPDSRLLSGAKLYSSRNGLISEHGRQEMIREYVAYRRDRIKYERLKRSPEVLARAQADGCDEPEDKHIGMVNPRFKHHNTTSMYDIRRLEPFDKNSVRYDDILHGVEQDQQHHNRLVLIIQGLLDRSPVFHPHPDWKLWTDRGFEAALKLILDSTNALVAGEAPDFEAYRTRLNLNLKVGSVTIGQYKVWLEEEREKIRGTRHWREAEYYRGPYGNPGPGLLDRVAGIGARTKQLTYRWERDRLTWDRWGNKKDKIPVRFTCHAKDVFNVDAYTPGDYKQFYNDPRTRAQYIKWAEYLLLAEEYHAGNRKVGEEG